MADAATFLGFYWGPREEDIETCSTRVLNFLKGFSALSEHFTAWKSIPKMQRIAWRRHDAIKQLLSEGINRTDVGNRPIESLGFKLSLLSLTPEGQPFNLGIACGCYSPQIKNLCMLMCPKASSASDAFGRLPVLLQACELIVGHWDPDYGAVTSDELADVLDPEDPNYAVGWLTYRATRGKSPVVPSAFESIDILNRGKLFLATSKQFSLGRADHIEAVQRLAALLGRAKKSSRR